MKKKAIFKILFLALVSANNQCINKNNTNEYKREPIIEGITGNPYYLYIPKPTDNIKCTGLYTPDLEKFVIDSATNCFPALFTFKGEKEKGNGEIEISVDVKSLVNEQCSGDNLLTGIFKSDRFFSVSSPSCGLCLSLACTGSGLEGFFYTDETIIGTYGDCYLSEGCRIPVNGILNDLARYELPEEDNECQHDSDCKISGCSSEVCSAQSVNTTCEAIPPPPGDKCLCLANRCKWYK